MSTQQQQHTVIVCAVYVVHVFLLWAAYAGQWCLSAGTGGGVFSRCALTGLSAAILGGIVFLLQRCLDAVTKTRLVFWRLWGPPYPGTTAFTEWIHEEPRANPSVIAARHGSLPVDPEEQNALWDRLFRMNEAVSSVENAHWRFALARDLAANWLMFGLCALLLIIWGHSPIVTKAVFAIANIGIAVLLIRAARRTGVQLVKNVLVAECTDS